jgi:hypothetical protein
VIGVFRAFVGPIERKHRWTVMRAARQVAVRVLRDWPGGVVWRAANPISEMHDLIDVESPMSGHGQLRLITGVIPAPPAASQATENEHNGQDRD